MSRPVRVRETQHHERVVCVCRSTGIKNHERRRGGLYPAFSEIDDRLVANGIAHQCRPSAFNVIAAFWRLDLGVYRSLIGAFVLIPVYLVLRKNTPRRTGTDRSAQTQTLLTAGIVCGTLLCLASNFQQFGIKYTSVGKAGFITACYIVLVPVFGLFLKKKTGPFLWAAVALAVVGLYLLCITDSFRPGRGDILVMICAVLFSFQILAVDHYSPLVESAVALSMLEFFVSGILSCFPALVLEHPLPSQLLAAWKPILYAGVFSCGVAYTLQTVAQKDLDPTVASLIMSLESCISVLAGWAILGQKLTARELLGCAVMFGAIVLAQLPNPDKGKKHPSA